MHYLTLGEPIILNTTSKLVRGIKGISVSIKSYLGKNVINEHESMILT